MKRGEIFRRTLHGSIAHQGWMISYNVLNASPANPDKIKLGWITSWNTKCGIASYSKFLIDAIDRSKFDLCIFASTKDARISSDELYVSRCWEDNAQRNLSDLMSQIADKKIEVLVIQFNFAFFNLSAFESLISKTLEQGITIIIFFHATADVTTLKSVTSLRTIAQSLAGVDRLFVHSINDLNRLKNYGLIHNVTLFPQGVVNIDFEDSDFIKHQFKITDKKIIASYGFLLPHKGIKELIEAFHNLTIKYPHLHLLLINALYPKPESAQLREECIQLIKQLKLSHKVTMINEYPDGSGINFTIKMC